MNAIEVAHASPGRVRLRVSRSHRHPDHLDRLQAELSQRPGVDRVETNHRTGSVLVTGTDDGPLEDGILADVDEIGDVLSFGMAGSEVEGMATHLGATIGRLDRRIFEATGENYHLGTLVPGSMAVLGVWQTVRTGLGLELIPGPLMLWLAWDLYRSFGQHPTEEQARAR